MQTLKSVRLPPPTQESNRGSPRTEQLYHCSALDFNITSTSARVPKAVADYNYSSPSQSISSNSNVRALMSHTSSLPCDRQAVSRRPWSGKQRTFFPPRRSYFLIVQERDALLVNVSAWITGGLRNGFLMFLVLRREKRSQNTCYTGNREQEIKSVLSALALGPRCPKSCLRAGCWFNWRIPLYKLRIIAIWLVAFAIQPVNYSREKRWRRRARGCETSLTPTCGEETTGWRRARRRRSDGDVCPQRTCGGETHAVKKKRKEKKEKKRFSHTLKMHQ